MDLLLGFDGRLPARPLRTPSPLRLRLRTLPEEFDPTDLGPAIQAEDDRMQRERDAMGNQDSFTLARQYEHHGMLKGDEDMVFDFELEALIE